MRKIRQNTQYGRNIHKVGVSGGTDNYKFIKLSPSRSPRKYFHT